MISAITDNAEVEQAMIKRHPLGRLNEPHEIANAVVFLASGMSDGVTGLNLCIDGGLHSQISI